MNNYGFNGLNNENPLMQYLRQYVPQQAQEQPQSGMESQRTNNSGASAFEINSQSELEYIVPDKSGRKQIVDCPNENKVYIGRYNHVKQAMDWRPAIYEEVINLSQNNDTSAEMSQIAQALVLVVNKLEEMDKTINVIKDTQPKVIEKIVEKPVEVVEDAKKEESTINEVSNLLKELEYKKAELEMLETSRKTKEPIKEIPTEIAAKTGRDSNGRFAKKGGNK